MAFEGTKERLAQIEKSSVILNSMIKMDGLEWDHRVAIIDATIAIESQINEMKSFLEKHDVER